MYRKREDWTVCQCLLGFFTVAMCIRIDGFMRKAKWLMAVVGISSGLALTPAVWAQAARPYIGYAYPAGGQRGTTVYVKLGGQNLNDVNGVLVTGSGVTAKLVSYYRPLGPIEMNVLN